MPVYVWLLIIGIIALLAGIGGSSASRGPKGQKKITRIDHPHYVTADESECSACGARFRGKRAACPRCGARFEAVKEDRGEWDEEFDDECDMDDEEEGR